MFRAEIAEAGLGCKSGLLLAAAIAAQTDPP